MKKSSTVFVVYKKSKAGPQIQGIFNKKTSAVKACKKWTDTILEIPFNTEFPRRLCNAGIWHHPKSGRIFRRGKWIKAESLSK